MSDCKERTCWPYALYVVMLTVMDGLIEDIAVSKMGERYGALRIVNPRADDAMVKSMKKYGQMSPVVCVMTGGVYELIDGFKRLKGLPPYQKGDAQGEDSQGYRAGLQGGHHTVEPGQVDKRTGRGDGALFSPP